MQRIIGYSTVIMAMVVMGCSMPGASMLNKVPINSVQVEVLDAEGNPIQGAQVEASNGRKSSTDADGMTTVRFGTVGIHNITVLADNYMPNNMVITMPKDNGSTVTARLTNEVEIGALSITAINLGGANMYPMMFNYLFTGYGYQLELEDYREGGWTEWRTDGEEDSYMRKALLKKLDNGQEWWQIILGEDLDDGDERYIAEVLFSEGRESIVRMREKIGENEAQEKPVSEGWYSEPQKLTKESIEGALSEEGVSITVPANTFNADLLDFGVAPGISMKMWRVSADQVPGAVVKYEYVEDEGGEVSSMELMDYGTDATTLLDSF
ncbi:MAG: Ig-like domain-containing protein [Gracilimonas sp.]